jgi:V/A-type H+-transporting ATPase subunit I
MSKAGMALAFNFIAIELIAPSGGIMLILGLLVFIVGHMMIFILAIISAGLHSIRLQYVELFTKFYEGGGLEFNPLKIIRKHTLEE